MSHFTVAVISKKYKGTEVGPMLKKYDEDDRSTFRDCTEEVINAWELGKSTHGTDINKEDYENIIEFAEKWFGYDNEGTEDEPKFGYHYNPDAKWDWYSIGGRWRGLLKLKEGVENTDETMKIERKSLWNNEEYEDIDPRAVNYAKIKDIDFTPDKNEYEKAKRFWELYIDGESPNNEEEQEILDRASYRKEYLTRRYKNKETYARLTSTFNTFAVLTDDGWFEKGEMGWFGASSETDEEEIAWQENYFKNFIENADGESYITIVDCHI